MFVGIDLGSRFVKIALYSDNKISFDLIDTVTFYQKYVIRIDNQLSLDLSFLTSSPVKICATGYGRNLINFKNADVISEIKAHYRGALIQTKEKDFVLLDVGGQDSKVIIVRDGYIEDFIMNDKCAASSGRFLESSAAILKMSVEQLGAYIDNPVKLSSTCSVFAESEIIGKIAEGCAFDSIAAGVNDSIARRLIPQVKRFNKHKIYVSGGVASLKGIVYFLSKHLAKDINVLKNPQFNGAIGCLSYAVEDLSVFRL
ncbi:MAG: acyl-CoA dehydratase activase [Calditerrivibrio sp.]|nr:acyl-CoA dehydratase activase [Calditerrivibrio sp.]